MSEQYLSLDSLLAQLSRIVSTFHQISTEEELIQLLHQLKQIDNEVNSNLDDFINKKQLNYEKNDLNLDLAKTELLTSLSSSSSLMKILSDSSYLARKLTYKVKYLDYERLRVLKTKEFVQHIINLRKNILLVHESLEQKDWDTVSKSISFILHEIPSDILTSSKFADIMIPSSEIPERPEILVKQWINDLKHHYVREFKNAVTSRDIVKLTNFFSYFPMINESKLGLSCYSDFINNIIADQARSLLVGAPRDRINFYSAAIMKLFEIVSKIINQHSKVIIMHYDADAMCTIIGKIQREVDSQAGLITDTFWDARNFDKIFHDINSYNFPILNAVQSGGGGGGTTTASNNNYYSTRSASPMGDSSGSQAHGSDGDNIYDDPIEQLISVVEIGDYINEIATLLNRWSLYCGFIAIKWKEYSTATATTIAENNSTDVNNKDSNYLQLVEPLLESSFLTKIEIKLVPCFNNLANYYLKKSLEKSYKLEELPNLAELIKPFLRNSTSATNSSSSDKSGGGGMIPAPLSLTEQEDFKPLETPPMSSIVEDLIIILNTILTNGIETGQPILLRNLINDASKILNKYFFKTMTIKLKDSQPRQGTNLLNIGNSINSNSTNNHNGLATGGGKDPNRSVITGNLASLRNSNVSSNAGGTNGDAPQGVLSNMFLRGASALSLGINDELKLTNYIVYFNSVCMFRSYFNRLITNLTTYNRDQNTTDSDGNSSNKKSILEANFRFGTDVEKLKELVNSNLVTPVNKNYELILKEYTEILYNQIFKNKIKSIFNDLFSYSNSYLIDSSSNTAISTIEIKKFIKSWLTLIKPYHRILSSDIFATLDRIIVDLAVEIIEKKIWLLNKKINLLGVLKLEKDVSAVINEVTKNNYSLRERFIRITQIIMIMGFDDEAEEEEMEWILTNNERRKARYLRIDRN